MHQHSPCVLSLHIAGDLFCLSLFENKTFRTIIPTLYRPLPRLHYPLPNIIPAHDQVGNPLTAKSPTIHLFSCHQYMLFFLALTGGLVDPPLLLAGKGLYPIFEGPRNQVLCCWCWCWCWCGCW